MKLDDVLVARRTMDYAATAYPNEIFELAKQDYFAKLKIYKDEAVNQESVEHFRVSEQNRAQQLTLFNSSRSDHEHTGDNEAVRERPSYLGSKGPSI